jgi:hypothetical protein
VKRHVNKYGGWRLTLKWRIHFTDGQFLDEHWPIPVPEDPRKFWDNLKSRLDSIRERHGPAVRIEVRNPVDPNGWVDIDHQKKTYKRGFSKIIMGVLIFKPTGKCPHCGGDIDIEGVTR